MNRVFVDTSGFFAHLSTEDAHNKDARFVFEQAEVENWRLLTTNVVVFETYALLQTRLRHGNVAALELLDLVDQDFCAIERVTAEDEEQAKGLVRRHQDKSYSLCDAASFVVMERLGVTQAISYDRHFRSYGKFTVL